MTNASPAKGRSPVDTQTWMRAVDAGDTPAVESLLDAGADVNVAFDGGETALMRASSKGHLGLVRVLLGAGADIHARSENGFTALFVAVFFGHADVVRALLLSGADPAAQTRLGMTAEQCAMSNGSNEIVELLRNPDAARAGAPVAESATKGEAQTDRAELFPAGGRFRTVVPLSEIDEAPAPAESAVSAEAFAAGAEALDLSRIETNELGPEEQEEATLVTARAGQAYSLPPRVAHGARLRGALQSWPVIGLSLALLLGAGALLDSVWKNSRRPAEPAPSATLAEHAPPAEGVKNQSAPAQPAAATDSQPPQPAPQVPERGLPAVADSATEQNPPAIASTAPDEAKPKAEKADKKSQPAVVSGEVAERKRTPDATTTARREAIAEARERQTAAAEKGGPTVTARQGTRAALRTQTAQGRVLASPSSEHSAPVFSPPPAAKSSAKQVIPWP